jgi:hypothetical protein
MNWTDKAKSRKTKAKSFNLLPNKALRFQLKNKVKSRKTKAKSFNLLCNKALDF